MHAAATAVKSRARPQTLSKPPPDLPLPALAPEASDRRQMLEELFSWPSKLVKGYLKLSGDYARDASASQQAAVREMLSDLEECSISTSFSGIDTPATAFMSVGWGLCNELGMTVDENAFAIEIQSSCQHELMTHPHTPDHVFGDIEGFWVPSIARRLDDMEEKGMVEELLDPLIRSGKATKRSCWCVRHQQHCQASVTMSDNTQVVCNE